MEEHKTLRESGGRNGREEGYDYEYFVRDLINNNKKVGETLLALKYGKKVGDIKTLQTSKLPEGKAADLKIENCEYYVGVDCKKPNGAVATQWMRKRIPLFLESASENEKRVFLKYFEYDSPSHGKRVYDSYSDEEKRIIFDFINKNKFVMIKKRWDSDPKTWCDFLIITSEEKIEIVVKVVLIDDLLNNEITFQKMRMKQKNYSFGYWIVFKPYGSHQPDIQFFINKGVFDSEYAYHITLDGKIIKMKSI
jgi:hypothetical protein